MQATTRKVTQTTTKRITITVAACRALLSLLLLTSTFDRLHSCACAQLPSRTLLSLVETDQGSGAGAGDGTADAHSSAEQKLKQLEESRANPIPMAFYKELDGVSDISDFIDRFVDKDTIDPKLGIQENIRRPVERASAVIPKPANCMPESTIVPLIPFEPSKDPKVIYYPKCTRVKRCSGCCSSELMACQPTEVETINFEITKYRYGERSPLRGKEIVVVEQHNKCKCDCRIKEKDCHSYQIYRAELCRCICTNDDALRKCLDQDNKFWDEQECRCVCRDTQTCTSGTNFDQTECRCVDSKDGGSKGVTPSLLDRRRFIVKAIPVEPNESTIYTV